MYVTSYTSTLPAEDMPQWCGSKISDAESGGLGKLQIRNQRKLGLVKRVAPRTPAQGVEVVCFMQVLAQLPAQNVSCLGGDVILEADS
jgi:hypothetical protein